MDELEWVATRRADWIARVACSPTATCMHTDAVYSIGSLRHVRRTVIDCADQTTRSNMSGLADPPTTHTVRGQMYDGVPRARGRLRDRNMSASPTDIKRIDCASSRSRLAPTAFRCYKYRRRT